MADVYGVVPSDIAGELPGIFPAGFSATSIPTAAQVESMITTADTMIGLRVLAVTGEAPDPDASIAVIAVRYIIEWTKALCVRIAYAGRGPADVNAAAGPYATLAAQLLEQLVIEEEADEIGVWGAGTVVRGS